LLVSHIWPAFSSYLNSFIDLVKYSLLAIFAECSHIDMTGITTLVAVNELILRFLNTLISHMMEMQKFANTTQNIITEQNKHNKSGKR
jgi:hypothetical protein